MFMRRDLTLNWNARQNKIPKGFSMQNDCNKTSSLESRKGVCVVLRLDIKNSPVEGWGGLSKKSNIKMSKEIPKLVVMHNTSIVKMLNSYTLNETQNFNWQCLTPLVG